MHPRSLSDRGDVSLLKVAYNTGTIGKDTAAEYRLPYPAWILTLTTNIKNMAHTL